jgi:hypothetical protein
MRERHALGLVRKGGVWRRPDEVPFHVRMTALIDDHSWSDGYVVRILLVCSDENWAGHNP